MDRYLQLLILTIIFLGVSVFFHWLFYRQSKKYTLKKANTHGIRWGSQTKPVSGGITFFMVFLLAIIGYFIFYGPDDAADNTFIGIILAISISFLMGLADDIINTSPFFKFFIQILSAVILITFDIHIHLFQSEIANYLLTVLWVIGIMNSINMLDNMDAITTSVSIPIIALTIGNLFLNNTINHNLYIFVSVAIIASLATFLLYNWPPSKMYMGDNGSQFLGAALAVLSIVFIWNEPGKLGEVHIDRQGLAIACAFVVPLTDTLSVTINRLLKGKSPFVGGRDHTTHNLSYLGLTEKGVARLLFGLSIISAGLSFVIINFIEKWTIMHDVIFSLYVIIVFGALFIITRIPKKNQEKV